jgi:hypothetical protein
MKPPKLTQTNESAPLNPCAAGVTVPVGALAHRINAPDIETAIRQMLAAMLRRADDGEPLVEKFVPVKEGARLTGAPYRQVLAAIKRGELETYRIGASHDLVRPSEISALIFASRRGGANG